jgi:hypothetical protein
MEKSVRASCHHAPEIIARQLHKRETPEAMAEKDRNFRREDRDTDVDEKDNGCEPGQQSNDQQRAANDFASADKGPMISGAGIPILAKRPAAKLGRILNF